VCAQNVCSPVQDITYASSQFSVVYNGTTCGPGTHVSWVDVGLEAMTPSSGGTNTTITIGAQVSKTATGFTPATPVTVGTLTGPPANQSATWNNFPLSPALGTISATAEDTNYLQVTFQLNTTTNKAAAPTITDWRVRFDCAASE
jgi:hypothetical protein